MPFWVEKKYMLHLLAVYARTGTTYQVGNLINLIQPEKNKLFILFFDQIALTLQWIKRNRTNHFKHVQNRNLHW